MSLPTYHNIAEDIIQQTQCEYNHACLHNTDQCKVQLTEDRDVIFLRCLNENQCIHKYNYSGMQICKCPVQRAAHSLTH